MNSHMKIALGVLGNATSFALFMSPLPTFWKIYKQKSTGEYCGLPYVCTLFTCAFWLFYGTPYVKPDSLLLLIVNGTGCALELFYLTSYLKFASKHNKVMLMRIMGALSMALTTLVVITIFVIRNHADRQLLAGTLCGTLSILMYASPFSVMKKVIRSKSVVFMPFLLSLFSLLNALVWSAYSLVSRDIFMAVPNCAGCLCGLVQLCVYFAYRDYPESETSKDNKIKSDNVKEMTDIESSGLDSPQNSYSFQVFVSTD